MNRPVNQPIPRLARAALAGLLMTLAVLTTGGCSNGPTATSAQPAAPAASAPATETPESDEATQAAAAAASEADDEDDAATSARPQPADQTTVDLLKSQGARLICVDTEKSAEDERVSGAQIVPLSTLAEASAGWDPDSPVVVTSRVEAKSRSGAAYLDRHGFTKVYYLAEGHDGYTAPYQGSNARVHTTPPIVYFFWVELPEGMSTDGFDRYALNYVNWIGGIDASMDDLQTTYDGVVEIRSYELFSQTSAFIDAWEVYEDELGMGLPRWVLVDEYGDSTVLNGIPINVSLQRVYAFCERYREQSGS